MKHVSEHHGNCCRCCENVFWIRCILPPSPPNRKMVLTTLSWCPAKGIGHYSNCCGCRWLFRTPETLKLGFCYKETLTEGIVNTLTLFFPFSSNQNNDFNVLQWGPAKSIGHHGNCFGCSGFVRTLKHWSLILNTPYFPPSPPIRTTISTTRRWRPMESIEVGPHLLPSLRAGVLRSPSQTTFRRCRTKLRT